jgi:hypothetical protein
MMIHNHPSYVRFIANERFNRALQEKRALRLATATKTQPLGVGRGATISGRLGQAVKGLWAFSSDSPQEQCC